jgi:signal transduction histidine kinase/CheY-like chemotaxis protein
MDKFLVLDSAIHDIKETSKRTYQFGLVALVFALITLVANIVHGNWLSAYLVAGMFVSMLLILWINKKGKAITKILTVLTLSIFITVIAFAEGLKTGGYLYFIPVFFALPFLINNSKNYIKELSLYFTIPITCFATVIFFVEEKSSWQYIPDRVYQKMFYTNNFCILLLCAVFAFLSIFLERKYAAALVEQISKAEDAVEARTRFLSNMGHELRTPLNGIIGATNLIRKSPYLPEQSKYVDILKYCSDHMLGLVNDVLDFNKIEQDKLELHPGQYNISNILSQSILPFKDRFEEKQIELRLIIDPKINATVLVDDVRLVQVLNNMLSNALKFTEKGYVKLEANLHKIEQDKLFVDFSIEDTGIGIHKHQQQKIFNSFWQVYNESTRKYGGTGLGLTICQRLLGLMDSSLQVHSEEGKGSKFYFTIGFPILEYKVKKNQPVKAVESDNLKGMRILVAEDNVINMMIVKKILGDWKAEVTECENGRIAVEKLQEDSSYNLVLMDLEMPEMDGYTAVKEIKGFAAHVPVLAFTAALMDNVMYEGLLQKGFEDCVLKPFQPQHLMSKIKKYALQPKLV